MAQWCGCGEAIGGMSEAADANHANMHQHHYHTIIVLTKEKKRKTIHMYKNTADTPLPATYQSHIVREKEDSCWMACVAA